MTLESTLVQFSLITDKLSQISECQSIDDLLKIFQNVIEDLGFSSFTYWVIWPPAGMRKPLYISSFRKEYSKHYVDNDFKNIDPVWKQTGHTTTPFSWSTVMQKMDLNDNHRIVFEQSRDFAIRGGATLPFYGPGRTRAAISIASDSEQVDFDRQFVKYQHFLHIIGTYLHERLIKIAYSDHILAKKILSDREIEIMLWAARGKTNWEIGEILSIAENTVRNHIQNICQKYTVSNRTHAVSAAIINGDIIP